MEQERRKMENREVVSRYRNTRRVLLFWCLFVGVGAVAGAVGMLVAPDGSAMGMQPLLDYFQVLPLAEYLYQDFVFPGIALLCVNGLTNLTAAWLILRKKEAGIICGGLFGITLMAWITIQFVILPANIMSTLYFLFGICQALTGLMCWIFYQQVSFVVDRSQYSNIGTDPQQLVVYFSRMGYTRKAAMEEANRTGACLYEVRSRERTEGTLGFWWCGRFGMNGMEMPIEPIGVRLVDFEKVTICSPIWVFQLASPMKAFCRMAHGQIRKADYILVHYRKSSYENAAKEMDTLLGIQGNQITSISCQQGHVKWKKTWKANQEGQEGEHLKAAQRNIKGF